MAMRSRFERKRPKAGYSADPQTATRGGRWRLLLGVLASAMVTLLSAGTFAAATEAERESPVGAPIFAVAFLVQVDERAYADHQRSNAPSTAQVAPATSVAGNADVGEGSAVVDAGGGVVVGISCALGLPRSAIVMFSGEGDPTGTKPLFMPTTPSARSVAAKSAPEMASGLERTGSALSKSDALHRSVSWVVDNPAAQRFAIKGGDGVGRELYQLPGEVNGKSGVFEWIIDRSGSNPVINHQRFIPGGSVTGFPNQVVP